jgi:hypothetical protein
MIPSRCRLLRRHHVASLPPILACLVLSLAQPAGAQECSKQVYRIQTADPATLNLTDGEHVIGSAQTEHGLWEIHVNARAHVVAAPRYLVGGKALRPFPESQIPAWVRECARQLGQTVGAATLSGSRPIWILTGGFRKTATVTTTLYYQCWKSTATGSVTCIQIVCVEIVGGGKTCNYFII